MKSQTQKYYQSSKILLIKRGLITISILFFVASCTKSTDKVSNSPGSSSIDCSGPAKTFSVDVKPIIQASCGGCHGAGSNNGPGALTSYSQIFNARTDIRSAVISGIMPQNGSLTNAEKNSIICWIDNGALNN